MQKPYREHNYIDLDAELGSMNSQEQDIDFLEGPVNQKEQAAAGQGDGTPSIEFND